MTTINVSTSTLNLTVSGLTIATRLFVKPTTIKFYTKHVGITLTNVNRTPLAIANAYLDLSLDNVPQVEDPSVYQALLQIHSALDKLLEAVNDLKLNKVDK